MKQMKPIEVILETISDVNACGHCGEGNPYCLACRTEAKQILKQLKKAGFEIAKAGKR
jgi:hypothetical protein